MPLNKVLGAGFAYDSSVSNQEQHFLTELGRTFIHNGIHTGLAAGATLAHLLVVGAQSSHLKVYHASATAAPVVMAMSEAPTITAIGTLGVVNNKNRESSLVSASVVYEGTTYSAAGLHLEGDILAGSKQDGGSQVGGDDEWILRPGVAYLFTIRNAATATVDISFHLEWYDEYA